MFKVKSKFFETQAELLLAGMKVQGKESEERILLGDNNSAETDMLPPMRFNYDGVWISTGTPLYIHI
jgi:hypothetical protein